MFSHEFMERMVFEIIMANKGEKDEDAEGDNF